MTKNKRHQLIAILADQGDQYVSGQSLSEQLNISRTAVWKHMNELKKNGYQFESVPRKGYRLVSKPLQLDDNTIKWGLDTEWLGKTIEFRDKLDSTQDLAHQFARKNYPHGTVVITNRQLAGRGRRARSWESNHDGGIWLSMILRPDIPPHQASQMTLFVAVTLVETIERLTGVPLKIKWPNDLFIGNKKLCGILTEMQAELEVIQYLVIGFGVNVNQKQTDFPQGLQNKSTSLQMETGQQWNRTELVQAILQDFEQSYAYYLEHGFDFVKQKWFDHAYRIQEKLEIRQHNDTFRAVMEGINDDGALIVRTEAGDQRVIYSAEINW